MDAFLAGEDVVYTKFDSSEFHQPLALFTAVGLRSALTKAGLETVALATSNPLIPEFQQLPRITASTSAGERLVELETRLCEHPGLVEAGAHLIAVGLKPVAAKRTGS